MAQLALKQGPQPDPAQFAVSQAVGVEAGAALRDGLAPNAPGALAIIEQLEALSGEPEDRTAAADRIEAFSDRRVTRYWTLVGIVNGWPPAPDLYEAWAWYAKALRAHA